MERVLLRPSIKPEFSLDITAKSHLGSVRQEKRFPTICWTTCIRCFILSQVRAFDKASEHIITSPSIETCSDLIGLSHRGVCNTISRGLCVERVYCNYIRSRNVAYLYTSPTRNVARPLPTLQSSFSFLLTEMNKSSPSRPHPSFSLSAIAP